MLISKTAKEKIAIGLAKLPCKFPLAVAVLVTVMNGGRSEAPGVQLIAFLYSFASLPMRDSNDCFLVLSLSS